ERSTLGIQAFVRLLQVTPYESWHIMKVAYIVTRADSLGGAQVHVLDLAQALRAHGGQPVVLAGGDGPFAAELRRRNVPSIEIRNLVRPVHPARDALAFVEILAALRR